MDPRTQATKTEENRPHPGQRDQAQRQPLSVCEPLTESATVDELPELSAEEAADRLLFAEHVTQCDGCSSGFPCEYAHDQARR